MWEDRRLRDITETDLRQLVAAGYEEGLQLEYKQVLYDENDRGRREFLQDVCMFANVQGGLLLIGIPEARDGEGQPTGAPDPNAQLGIDVANPEQLLLSYDARVVSSIEERVRLESAPIAVAEGRYVLAIRIPNSLSKPHCVRYQGQVYFPSRRERHRYHMDVREIKEMIIRTASRLEEAERKLSEAFLSMPCQDTSPHLVIGCIPVFWQNFSVDVGDQRVLDVVGRFDPSRPQQFRMPTYDFQGLERRIGLDASAVHLHRDGLVVLNRRFQLVQDPQSGERHFWPKVIDPLLRTFLLRAADVYRVIGLSGPYLVGMMLRIPDAVTGAYEMFHGSFDEAKTLPARDYPFPVVHADDLINLDRIMRPLCDQAHQTFGQVSSPYFNDGVWIGP